MLTRYLACLEIYSCTEMLSQPDSTPRVGAATVLAAWLMISAQGCGRKMSLFLVIDEI